MRVLITGGLGWLGKALTEVVSQHHTVRVFDLESAEAPRQELDFDGEVIFGSVTDYEAVPQEEICRWFVQLYGLNVISLRLGDILDLERGMSKHGDEAFHQAIANESWVHRYDVGQACLQALGIPHQGHDVFHLIGAPSARKRFDVARAESVLDIKFTTEFDRRSAGER